MEENKVKVKNWDISYIKFGRGPKHILFLTGDIGDGLSMTPLLQELNPEKFTGIAWDPPGYGKSQPPERVMSDNLHEEDAEYAYEFMKALKIQFYSVLGFCGGGRVAMILAAQHPDHVETMMLLNASTHVLPHEEECHKKIIDVQIWPSKYKQSMKEMYNYNEEDLQYISTRRTNTFLDICRKRNNDICSHVLPLIQCKTLILHGAKDLLVDKIHASYLGNRIKNSRVHVYLDGAHGIHNTHTKDVMERIQQLILDSP